MKFSLFHSFLSLPKGKKSSHALHLILIVCSICLILPGCGSKKKAISDKQPPSSVSLLSKKETAQLFESQSAAWQGAITAKARFNLSFGTASYALNGTLRMKHDEILQLSFQVPLLGMEAARIEITPTKVLVLDRIHRKYVEEPMESLSAMTGTGLDFYALQALFGATLFRPGETTFTLADANRMNADFQQNENTIHLSQIEKGLSYTFGLSAATMQLLTTTVAKPSTTYACHWQYSTYKAIKGRAFPTRTTATFIGGSKKIAMEMELSRIQNEDWKSDTSVSSRYQRMTLAEVTKLFSSL